MRFRFRVWMPVAAVLLVLLSVAALLLYVLPATKTRLANVVEDRALVRAAAAANAAADSEGQELQSEMELAAEAGEGQVIVVDREGSVIARAGPELLYPPPEEIVRRAADGERLNEMVGGQRVAVVPLIHGGSFSGGGDLRPRRDREPHQPALFA